MIKCKHKEIMLLDDFDICLIFFFLSLNKYDRYHVAVDALETHVNIQLIRAVFSLQNKGSKI